jgi:hypothetical protein
VLASFVWGFLAALTPIVPGRAPRLPRSLMSAPRVDRCAVEECACGEPRGPVSPNTRCRVVPRARREDVPQACLVGLGYFVRAEGTGIHFSQHPRRQDCPSGWPHPQTDPLGRRCRAPAHPRAVRRGRVAARRRNPLALSPRPPHRRLEAGRAAVGRPCSPAPNADASRTRKRQAGKPISALDDIEEIAEDEEPRRLLAFVFCPECANREFGDAST